VAPAGVAVYNLTSATFTLPMLLAGTSVLIFDQPDDNQSQPAGNAGRPLACGTLGTSPTGSVESASSVVVGLLGALLIAGGIVLRRGA
jgi:hypothetical protein